MPHAAQELFLGEYTPTLCQVIPIYGELLQLLQELCLEKIEQDKPQIGHTIAASIKKLRTMFSRLETITFMHWQWVDLPIILTQTFQVIQFTFCSY